MTRLVQHARAFWRRMSRLDRVALLIVALYALEWIAEQGGWKAPSGFLSLLAGLLAFLFFFSAAYLAVRLVRGLRGRILWRLRNRLIVAYVFIAVVPVLLLLTMAGILSYLVYTQFGAYLLAEDLRDRRDRVADIAENLAALVAHGVIGTSRTPESSSLIEELKQNSATQLPGLAIVVHPLEGQAAQGRGQGGEQASPRAEEVAGRDRLAKLVQRGNELWLEASAVARAPSGALAVARASVPVTPEFLDSLAPDLGPVQFTLMDETQPASGTVITIEHGGRKFYNAYRISSRKRTLGPPAGRFDFRVNFATTFDAEQWKRSGHPGTIPVLASFTARGSSLKERLFASLGVLGEPLVILLIVIGVIFLLLEVSALITGIVLTRTITHTVGDLYAATQAVKTGDFSHRFRIERKDQLGALGESFNAMTSAIVSLLEEQRQKQRLENELSIAREVQAQLFPQSLPSLPGFHLAAICRAARVVSGDYYDCLQLDANRIGIAVADISGKGISAALLMASLQAALRSQALLDGTGVVDTAKLTERLHRHLLLNTADDRYATFFYAVYDTATRTLYYTNAGHVPPLYISGNQVTKLQEGGTVVGLIEGSTYVQGTIQTEPGSLLLAYSDGAVEPENVYGEQFGMNRLIEEVLRVRDAVPEQVVEDVVTTVSNWGGSAEQSDDMTVLAARMD